MSKWKNIWENKKADEKKLLSKDIQTIFMELKRLDGNDTTGKGVSFESFNSQYQRIKKELLFSVQNKKISTIFEVGCGSAPFLLLFELDNFRVGGMDYSEALIHVAKKVLKNPIEIYCDEAQNIDIEQKYDCVYSNSVFEYFEDENYASLVLSKMYDKANHSLAVLDVHDADYEEEFLTYRKSLIDNYEERYKDLPKLFYRREFFLNFAKEHNLEIKFTYSDLKDYWNSKFVFDVYMWKR